MWFFEIMRKFFFMIDNAILGIIPFVYDLLIKLARTSVLSQGQIKEFADRIQILFGVFMLFKVSFSMITYILNPDEFSDKSKGFGKIWQNVIISLIILVLTPYAFNLAYDLQGRLLQDNSIATLIFGESTDTDKDFLNSAGDKMAFIITLPFFSPDTSLAGTNAKGVAYDLGVCSDIYSINSSCSGEDCCMTQLNYALGYDTSASIDTSVLNYVNGIEHNSLGLTFRVDMATKTAGKNASEGKYGDNFVINYTSPISTVVAVVTLLLLVTFCLDVALRSIKLAFLQLIAPIPIISYIDPKSGKDGMFKKWYTMCFSTYISLFVRLLALYFGIYIISMVASFNSSDATTGSSSRLSLFNDPLMMIFVVIGVLMFMKQLPKILEGLGIKLDGGGKFTLNPFRKVENEALGGNLLKPINDKAAKLGKDVGKGIIGLPKVGAGKLLSGFNAMAHGHTFRSGSKRFKTNFGKAVDKFYETYLPYSSEERKSKIKGLEKGSDNKLHWKRGKSINDKLTDFIKKNNLRDENGKYLTPKDLFDGDPTHEEAYRIMGLSGEMLKTKMELDAAQGKQKKLRDLQQQAYYGRTQEEKDAAWAELAKMGIYDTNQLSKAFSDQEKIVSGKQKNHDINRDIYTEQARIEDDFTFYKNNQGLYGSDATTVKDNSYWGPFTQEQQEIARSFGISEFDTSNPQFVQYLQGRGYTPEQIAGLKKDQWGPLNDQQITIAKQNGFSRFTPGFPVFDDFLRSQGYSNDDISSITSNLWGPLQSTEDIADALTHNYPRFDEKWGPLNEQQIKEVKRRFPLIRFNDGGLNFQNESMKPILESFGYNFYELKTFYNAHVRNQSPVATLNNNSYTHSTDLNFNGNSNNATGNTFYSSSNVIDSDMSYVTPIQPDVLPNATTNADYHSTSSSISLGDNITSTDLNDSEFQFRTFDTDLPTYNISNSGSVQSLRPVTVTPTPLPASMPTVPVQPAVPGTPVQPVTVTPSPASTPVPPVTVTTVSTPATSPATVSSAPSESVVTSITSDSSERTKNPIRVEVKRRTSKDALRVTPSRLNSQGVSIPTTTAIPNRPNNSESANNNSGNGNNSNN